MSDMVPEVLNAALDSLFTSKELHARCIAAESDG